MITPSFSFTATERVLPKLALDFTTASLDPRVTFTRTTDATHPATYVNNSGVVTAATNNQPRFDYDPIALTCKGLLIEEQRTNLLKYSEQFNDSTWYKDRATISASNTIIAPDGTLTADRLQEDTTANNSHLIRQTVSVVSGTAYTWSVFLKNDNRRYAQLTLGDGGAAFNNVNCVVDLQLGTILSTTAGVLASSIIAFGNGWYRISVTGSAIATTAFGYAYIFLRNSTSASYNGDGYSGIYLWGAQVEAGAFPTSYIPTTTTALTRNADVATMTGTNFSSWFNASEGTFEVEGFVPPNLAGFPTSWGAVSDGTDANRIQSYFYTSGVYTTIKSSNVAQGDNGVVSSPVVGAAYKQTVAYKTDNCISGYNGLLGGLDSTVTLPTVNKLQFGTTATGVGYVNACIKKFTYYKQRLINAEVQAFSK